MGYYHQHKAIILVSYDLRKSFLDMVAYVIVLPPWGAFVEYSYLSEPALVVCLPQWRNADSAENMTECQWLQRTKQSGNKTKSNTDS